jgi:hypothetical protein
MNNVRRILDLDPQTNTRLDALAAERGQDPATVVADAVQLLDTILDIEGPDLEEDRRRVSEFERTREAIPFEEVMRGWNRGAHRTSCRLLIRARSHDPAVVRGALGRDPPAQLSRG